MAIVRGRSTISDNSGAYSTAASVSSCAWIVVVTRGAAERHKCAVTIRTVTSSRSIALSWNTSLGQTEALASVQTRVTDGTRIIICAGRGKLGEVIDATDGIITASGLSALIG